MCRYVDIYADMCHMEIIAPFSINVGRETFNQHEDAD